MNAKKIFAAALMTLGLAAVPTIASAHERYVVEEHVVVYDRDYRTVETLRYALLPGRLQDAVDDQRRGNPVDHIQRIREHGRETYQMVIYGRHCDTLIRLDCDGRLVSRQEVACERADYRDYHHYDRAPYDRFRH